MRTRPGLTAANHERQQELRAALGKAAPDNPIAQLGLIYVYANRLGTAQVDVNAVRAAIIGGPVRECAG